MTTPNVMVVCTFESGEYPFSELDALATKHQGELIGWGGGGKWAIDREYSFKTKKKATKFQEELSSKLPGVQSFIQK